MDLEDRVCWGRACCDDDDEEETVRLYVDGVLAILRIVRSSSCVRSVPFAGVRGDETADECDERTGFGDFDFY